VSYRFACGRLREFARSESERSFNEAQVRRARLQSLGLAYLSPQNRTVAQSFRYMRHKPTIIAFKTPSMEEAQEDALVEEVNAPNGGTTVAVAAAEEGNLPAQTSVLNAKRGSITPAKFPIGKPLEVRLIWCPSHSY
jgi:NADPH oxidase 5